MNKINCNIIRDLLPSYLDKLTSKESNELIETHLEDCSQCKEMLVSLSQTVTVDTNDANREIDYLKKIKDKRKKLLLVAVLVCTLIFGVVTAIGIKVYVIGTPVSFAVIDGDKTDEYVGIGTRFNPATNELTLYGEIQSRGTAFSGIKVEEAKGLVHAYNVTVYGAERFGNTQESSRKFEHTFKLPDDNNNWTVYSVGEIPQDTIMFWTNAEYVDKKAELPLQKLTAYLTQHEGFSAEESHLERDWFEEILSDQCFTFDFHSNEDCMSNILTIEYAVSEDGERIYFYDFENDKWVLQANLSQIFTDTWPANKYTDMISMPEGGKVSYYIDDSKNNRFSVFLTGLTADDSSAYIQKLLSDGYSEIATDKNSVSAGTLLEKDNVMLSIAYSADILAVSIVLE